jgi:hypothetical protein
MVFLPSLVVWGPDLILVVISTTGDVVYIHVFGQGLVFLNSFESATELLDKRGSIYSDKPRFVMCSELYVSFSDNCYYFHFAKLE